MDDKQYKRLARMFTVMWLFLLAAVIVILFLMPKDNTAELKRYIDTRTDAVHLLDVMEAAGFQQLPPRDGIDGRNGVDGQDGKDGTDGKTIVTERIIHETITLPGEKGAQGDRGEPGLTPKLQINPVTGDLETQYEGDKFWQVLIPCAQLQKTCEVQP